MNDLNLAVPEGKRINVVSTYVISISAVLYGVGIATAHHNLVNRFIERGDLIRPFDHQPKFPENHFLIIQKVLCLTSDGLWIGVTEINTC